MQMAKDKSSGKKTEKSADLEDMREAFRKHKERAKGGGGGDNAWDKLGDGKNMRRILPRPGERKFYTEGWTHFNVGPNNRAVRCIDEASINVDKGLPESGTKCPLCKKFLREQSRINSEYQKGDEDGRAEWKRAKDKFVPRHQYYSNVLVADEDDDVEVKLLAFGTQVWSQLMNYYLGDDTAIGDFTKPVSGRWMNIKKEKKGGRDRRNIEYKVFPASESSDISDAWDDIKAALHDLEGAAGKIMSKDEIIAIMKGVDLNKGSDSDDDDDDEDEDEDDDSSSDSGSDEEEDEDKDDDEEERPKKSSKLSSKMGKKKRGDD
jgi:hypothetical protein